MFSTSAVFCVGNIVTLDIIELEVVVPRTIHIKNEITIHGMLFHGLHYSADAVILFSDGIHFRASVILNLIGRRIYE